MKRSLLTFLAIPFFFLLSCNKEIPEGEYDLNNDGNSKMIFSRYSSKGFIAYSPKGNFDIDTVYNFGSIKPFSWGFGHENDDPYLDIWEYRRGKNGDERFVVYNNKGTLLGEKEKKVE